jgi:SOS response regulatory protein OraA/RecX
MKLMKKGFQKEMIREYIERHIDEIEDWESQKNTIIRQIETLMSRGKSTRMITALLGQKYPYFREEIGNLLENLDNTDALEKEMQKYKNRYNIHDPKDREKIIAALLRKGFSYGEIKGKIGGRR